VGVGGTLEGTAEGLFCFCMQALESPSDSYPWIQFMAFHVELGELAKARAVAERALQTISFRQACNLLLLIFKMHCNLYMEASCMAEQTPNLPLPALFSLFRQADSSKKSFHVEPDALHLSHS
jgi:hypothetical protein